MKKDGSQGGRGGITGKCNRKMKTAALELKLKSHKGKISYKSLISDFMAAFGGGGRRKRWKVFAVRSTKVPRLFFFGLHWLKYYRK